MASSSDQSGWRNGNCWYTVWNARGVPFLFWSAAGGSSNQKKMECIGQMKPERV